MTDKLEKKLKRKYYHLGYTYSACSDGWYKIIESTLKQIDNELYSKYIPRIFKKIWYWLHHTDPMHIRFNFMDRFQSPFVIYQIKEKWGALNIYTNFITDNIDKLIDVACDKSIVTCEYCGKDKDDTLSGSWLKSICDECKLTN